MTSANEEIKECEQRERELSEILCLPFDDQPNKLLELGKRIGVNPPHNPGNARQEQVIYMTQSIHSFLQTKMMLYACVSAAQSCELAKQSSTTAKWACICAAVAAIASVICAIASCISVLLVLFCG